jgi:hypothetical protein
MHAEYCGRKGSSESLLILTADAAVGIGQLGYQAPSDAVSACESKSLTPWGATLPGKRHSRKC